MHDLSSAGREKFYYDDRKDVYFSLKRIKTAKLAEKTAKFAEIVEKNYGKIKLHIIKIFSQEEFNMTDAERKRTEEEIRTLRAELEYMERDNPRAAEGVRKQIQGLELYLRGF